MDRLLSTIIVVNDASIEEIRIELNVDTLRYIDINVLRKVSEDNICTYCFTGKYDSELFSWEFISLGEQQFSYYVGSRCILML